MEKRPELLYLSGPMSGYPQFNYPAFHAAAMKLRERGYAVVNPAETAGGEVRLSRATFLRMDIGYIQAADAVVVLPGWGDSKGAVLEVMLAANLGLPVYVYDEDRDFQGQLKGLRFQLAGGYLEYVQFHPERPVAVAN